VARRPVEQFEITVEQPEWQLEPDDEAYFGEPEGGMQVDADGNPIVPQDPAYGAPFPDRPAPLPGSPPPSRDQARPRVDEPQLDQEWIDNATGRSRPVRREEEPVDEEAPTPLA
jgi:penicillin-binding protein 1A